MNGEKIECPFCGSRTVLVTVLTKFCFKAEHTVYINGADMYGDSDGSMFGELACEPMVHYSSYRCTCCGKKWFPFEYQFVVDESGKGTFERHSSKKKGELCND